MYEILTQVIGFAGMGICISSFACKRSNGIVLLQAVGNALFIVHFLMLGAYSGCFNIAIVVFSNLILLLCMQGKQWASWIGWRWIFSLFSVIVCTITWRNLYSLLPCISTIVLILTVWTRRATVIRLGKITVVGPGWILYNLYVRSWSGVFSESFGILSALFSLAYYRWNGQMSHLDISNEDLLATKRKRRTGQKSPD